MSGERKFDAMHDVVDAVLDADTIDEAVVDIAQILGAQHDLWYVGVEVFTIDFTTKVIAAWTPVESFYSIGLEVAVDITADARQIATEVLLGNPVVCAVDALALGLYGDLLAREGIRTQMMAGLQNKQNEVVARIVLGSTSEDGFTREDIPFFTGLARGLEGTLLELAGASVGR